MEGIIERATIQDLSDILQLQRKAFRPVAELMNNFDLPPLLQTEESLLEEYTTDTILKYIQDGKIVGSVRGNRNEENICHIGKLIVDPVYQKRGIGRALMEAIEERFRECNKYTLFTGTETPNTFYLYQSIGYQEMFREFHNGILMIYMEKKNFTE